MSLLMEAMDAVQVFQIYPEEPARLSHVIFEFNRNLCEIFGPGKAF